MFENIFGITNSSHTPNSNILDTHAVLTQLMEGTALVACGTVNGWYIPKVKDIRFYDKATVVFWEDKTKTVVVLQDGDTYDKEKAVAMCFMKKATGNKGNFNDIFRKYGCDAEE